MKFLATLLVTPSRRAVCIGYYANVWWAIRNFSWVSWGTFDGGIRSGRQCWRPLLAEPWTSPAWPCRPEPYVRRRGFHGMTSADRWRRYTFRERYIDLSRDAQRRHHVLSAACHVHRIRTRLVEIARHVICNSYQCRTDHAHSRDKIYTAATASESDKSGLLTERRSRHSLC